jgi:hypothetical protein
MMLKRRFTAVIVVALGALALAAGSVVAATPKDGKYTGATTSGQKISLKVSDDGKKVKVNYCGYAMPDRIRQGKFNVAYKGPGGTYLALKGSFPTKSSAKGEVTTDFLCDTQGEKFTAKRQ